MIETGFKRNPAKEEAFYKRYRRRVEVHDNLFLDDKKPELKKAIARIVFVSLKRRGPGPSYEIVEFLKGGLTDYVLVGQRRFARHVDAEIFIIDQISQMED